MTRKYNMLIEVFKNPRNGLIFLSSFMIRKLAQRGMASLTFLLILIQNI